MSVKPDRQRQVDTIRERYGKKHYRKIGKLGGDLSPTKFNPDSARLAANIRWAKKRAADKLIEESNEIG